MSTDLRSLPAARSIVGGTPLLLLNRLSDRVGNRIWAKCEFLNPTGSVKDRLAGHLVRRYEETGRLIPGETTVVEATGGNTGLSVSALCAGMGYGLVFTMSDKMTREKSELMRSYGAEVVLCPYDVPPSSPQSFLNVAKTIAERPGHLYLDQFGSEWNVEIHELTTGPEIVAGLGRFPNAVVAGVGTGGTLMGIGRHLRAHEATTEIVLADPLGSILGPTVRGEPARPGPYLVEGIGGDFLPSLFDPGAVDVAITVPDDESVATCLRLQRDEGILAGLSSGCALAAALSYAESRRDEGLDIVVVVADSGDRYLSTVYSTAWREQKGLA